MNSIKSLLQQMNDSKLFLGKNHSIKIYGDGSGSMQNEHNFLGITFNDEVEMIKSLNDLYNELNEIKDMKWTL